MGDPLEPTLESCLDRLDSLVGNVNTLDPSVRRIAHMDIRQLRKAVAYMRDHPGWLPPIPPDEGKPCPTCGCEAPHKVLADLNRMVAELKAQIPDQRRVEEAYRKAGEVSAASLDYEVRGVPPIPERREPQ